MQAFGYKSAPFFEVMRFLLLLASAYYCLGQGISVGVAGGVRTTGDLTGVSSEIASESKRYVFGPTVGIDLPRNFSIEIDALYQLEGFRTSFFDIGLDRFGRERANSWTFPALVTYHFRIGRMKPFVMTGYAARILPGRTDAGSVQQDPLNGLILYGPNVRLDANWPVSQGWISGGGVRFWAGTVQFSPQLRYTRWFSGGVFSHSTPQGGGYQSAQNEIQILLDLSVRIRRGDH
jgi:hypothetical protein